MNIGHLEGLPHPYSLGDLYTITMVINPPTNWELILQALMLPFFMNRQKYRLTKLRCWKLTNQTVRQKDGILGGFFLMLPGNVSCKKQMGQQFYPQNTETSVFLFRWVFFLCVSQESSPNFSVWNSPTRSVINGVIPSIVNGLALLLSASPFTTSFSWPTLKHYRCFARKFGLQDSVEWPKCWRTFPNPVEDLQFYFKYLVTANIKIVAWLQKHIEYATTWNPNDLSFRRFFSPKTRPF